jgi:hypothetical protein
MSKWIVTGTFVVVDADTESDSVDRAQETPGCQWEQHPWAPRSATAEHRLTVTLRADVFPQEAMLPEDYTPEQVAREAWSSIKEWVEDGYQPTLRVRMEDGTEHLVDLGRAP